jgi:hydrogenase maturation protease
MTCDHPSRVLVLGLGNPLMADDGIGLAALEQLQAEWELPPEVTAVDGGTWGMNLLPLIEDTDSLLLLDAIRAGAEPGTLVDLGREQLPRYFALKLSPHQIDLKEVLALAELRGTMPARAAALGLVPERVEMSTELSFRVAERLRDLVLAAVDRLAHWGHFCARRPLAVHA